MGELRSAVDTIVATDPDELDPALLGELIVEVFAQRDRLDAYGHRLVALHDRCKAWEGDGARSEKQWLAQHCRLTPGEAGQRARLARGLQALPGTAAAAADGEISAGQARVAAQAVRDLPREALAGFGPAGDPDRAGCGRRPVAHCGGPVRASGGAGQPGRAGATGL